MRHGKHCRFIWVTGSSLWQRVNLSVHSRLMDGLVTFPVLCGLMHEFKVKYVRACRITTFVSYCTPQQTHN